MILEETLMAYVDGELSAEERAEFLYIIAEDVQLQKDLRREELLRRRILELSGLDLRDEPERPVRSPISQPASRALFGKPYPIGQAGWWSSVTAIAASLVLGLFLGQSFLTPISERGDVGATAVKGQLLHALETQLASSQAAADPVQIGITFISVHGQPCRTYESSGTAGLACRSQGRWWSKLVVPETLSPNLQYRQAASSSELVMRTAQDMLANDPMDSAQERRARDSGWTTINPS